MAEHAQATFTLEPFDYREARELMRELGLAEPVAVTLVRRGYRTVDEARAFLEADETHDPFLFEDMAEVVARIRAVASADGLITVHGDYDVDGVCSTAILVRAIRRLGAECDWVIPDRMGDGYGLSERTVEALIARGTRLLVTTDCGIGSVAEVEAARAGGLEVIVTDHHHPGSELPRCPILHPVVSGYPFAELCGTGVAYKLAAALNGDDEVAAELDLVALATVADVVALRGENRTLVRRGLAEARRARRPGMRALLESAAVLPERLDEGDFAFRIGPRINAAGRLYRADAGVELMLTEDFERARAIAAELERANRERREVELDVLAGAKRALADLTPEESEAPGLVLAGEGWHPGVVGIVASRLAEELWRPVVLIALDADGGGRGSGRSIPGFDLLAALDRCAEHLARYGGHRAAAGVELEAGKLAAFRSAFAAAAADAMPAEALVPTEPIDAVVGGEHLGHDVAKQLVRLGPFGHGNPAVRFLIPGARLGDVRPMGEGERHARFSVISGSRRALGVAFGVNGELTAAARGDPLDVSVRLELNEWNGAVEPRVVLGQLYPPAAAEDAAVADEIPGEEFWRRHDDERAAALAPWPAQPPAARDREVVLRRDASGVPTVAALVSGGEPVLVLVADAVRRRKLIEHAARPARFGGGGFAVASGRLPERSAAEAIAVRDASAGAVLADWALLLREPNLANGFAHVVLIDPPPHPDLEGLARVGSGFLHVVDGPAEAEFAARVYADEWPSRASLAQLYRTLGAALGEDGRVNAEEARRLICGPERTHALAPEPAARATRVLTDLALIDWDGSGVACTLGVVSSKGKDLEQSEAFRVYRKRQAEGRRWLNERRQKRS
ncbi:MAG TPA: single-stranded-DNA-specific exonuclease RecJ [Solirubrobacterales bacterium]|nr:single-stranded-DNA-specific exonuclease RecJ [Solirubrobacterales bacterium]